MVRCPAVRTLTYSSSDTICSSLFYVAAGPHRESRIDHERGRAIKVLYAIQATGNGHLCRAFDIVRILQERVDLDLLVSGIQGDVVLPFEVRHRLRGLSFIFGKRGGVDIWKTCRSIHARRLWREIRTFPAADYDLVINDFEPVSAWAARRSGTPCVSLSHQAAVLNGNSPRPERVDRMGWLIMKKYAPVETGYGFHFERYAENIFTPVIRRQVRDAEVRNEGHYTVYLPSYGDDRLIRFLSRFGDVEWRVFSKHSAFACREGNVAIAPVDSDAFVRSMATGDGVLCGAGFETPAEALFLGKKLMVIPMRAQYEQQCNAAAAARLGVPVVRALDDKALPAVASWVGSDDRVAVDYPDITEEILDGILETHLFGKD